MNVNVDIQLYPDAIGKLNEAIEKAGQQAATAVKTELVSLQILPKQVGELERSGQVKRISKSKYKIVYDTPYARRLYWNPFPEFDFRTDKNPYADGLWFQPFIDGYRKNFFSEKFIAFLKLNAGGLIE